MDVKKVAISSGILAIGLVLTGCGAFPGTEDASTPNSAETISEAKASIAGESSSKPTASSAPTPTSARTEVIWADYDPGTQGEIDRMTIAGDCLGINSYFGMATATEESVKARTGHGNEALTKYLNEANELANCR